MGMGMGMGCGDCEGKYGAWKRMGGWATRKSVGRRRGCDGLSGGGGWERMTMHHVPPSIISSPSTSASPASGVPTRSRGWDGRGLGFEAQFLPTPLARGQASSCLSGALHHSRAFAPPFDSTRCAHSGSQPPVGGRRGGDTRATFGGTAADPRRAGRSKHNWAKRGRRSAGRYVLNWLPYIPARSSHPRDPQIMPAAPDGEDLLT